MFQIKGLNISHKRDLRNMLEDFYIAAEAVISFFEVTAFFVADALTV